MKFKIAILAFIATLFSSQVHAQDTDTTEEEVPIVELNIDMRNYFVVGTDTVFCKELSYRTAAGGKLKEIHYIDSSGNKVDIKGKKKVPNVLTFHIGGFTTDKTPLDPHRPNSAVRYTDRAVDGKIKVYWAPQGHSSTGPVGTNRYFVKMPDGTLYKINNSDLKKHIKPYLIQCKAFMDQYKGNYSTDEVPFKEMIRLYNSVCD